MHTRRKDNRTNFGAGARASVGGALAFAGGVVVGVPEGVGASDLVQIGPK